MNETRLGYRFGPLERRGLLGPVRTSQAATVATSLVLAIGALDALPASVGMIAGILVVALALVITTMPVGGRAIDEWVPVVTTFASRRTSGRHQFRLPQPATGVQSSDEQRPTLPRELRGVRLLSVGHDGQSIGALSERRGRLLTAVLACRAVSFRLLDPEDQERRLALWGAVLSGAATTPINRLQWIERTAPAQGDELARWLYEARDPGLPARGIPIVDSYLELISQGTDVTLDHEVLLAIQLDLARTRSLRGVATDDILLEYVGQIARGLEAAEIEVMGALNSGQLAHTLRTAFDPYARGELRSGVVATQSAGPVNAREAWDHYRADGALHSTFWISGWPKSDISPMFMDGLLSNSTTVRTVAITFEPLAPERSVREAEAAVTRDRADSELRRRFGQSETARQRQVQEAAARRAAELAAGHSEVRLTGFVTVSGRDERDLAHACSELHRLAARSRIEVRRMYGQQADAFTYTLPLARGLR